MGSQITEGLGQAWAMVATFVPKLLGFLLVLVIGWFIAKALAKGVQFLLKRVGFEKLVDKSGLNGAMRQSSMDASGLIAKIVYYFVLLIALQLAFGVFGASNPVSTLLNEVIAYLPRIVVALVLVIVASAIGTALKGLVTGALGQRTYTKIMGNITYGFVMALGIIASLNQLGIAISVTMPVLIAVLATVAGVVIIGVGGGLVRPMQQRWEGWLTRVQDEAQAHSPMPRASQEMPQEMRQTVGGRMGDMQTPPSGTPMS